ncbi:MULTISPECIES: DNA-methyltransferase [Luteibacter]|uniref:DNA-methyltransferase n=1 Tax=Luteibacter TaxID=242605 RepID=UPI00056995B2|nr:MULTISPECIES: site-specific DNA-methyltransferase [unclassified Luteibacter]
MTVTIHTGDCRDVLRSLADCSVNTCVTSPPYFGLRDYDVHGQIGLEQTPEAFIAELVDVFREVRRVLRDDGTLWLNIGDSYANDGKWGGASGGKHAKALHGDTGVGRRKVVTGLKPKNLMLLPARVAIALQADGWYVRQDIIWNKPNAMPESVTDRCTKAHEYLFLLSKSERYYFDAEAIKEPAKEWSGRAATFDRVGNPVSEHVLPGQNAAQHRPRPSVKRGGFNGKTEAMASSGRNAFRAVVPMRNKRSVWNVATKPYKGAHFATFPKELIRDCILAGCPAGGTVLDPFGGAGTTGVASEELGRDSVLIELNPKYVGMSNTRLGLAGSAA